MKNDTRQDGKLDNEKGIKDIVRGFIGRDMTIMLRSKKILIGRLESVSQYELLLTVAHRPVLIMKHAIDYVELTEKTD